MVYSTQKSVYINKGVTNLDVEISLVRNLWQFQIIERLRSHCIIGFDQMWNRPGNSDFFEKSLVVNQDANTRKTEISSVSVDLVGTIFNKVKKVMTSVKLYQINWG